MIRRGRFYSAEVLLVSMVRPKGGVLGFGGQLL